MEDSIVLSETERKYFSDLFLCCDSDNNDRVLFNSAFKLFQSGNVPLDILNRITEIVYHDKKPNPTDQISRKQFYSVLKLISAYQAGNQLSREILNSYMDFPLPRFTNYLNNSSSSSESTNKIGIDKTNVYAKTTVIINQNHNFEDSENDSLTEMPEDDGNKSSPAASSPATSDSPTPTNSVQNHWVSTNAALLQSEEQRQLLATEEESSDNEMQITEIWSISSEQRDYYLQQFCQMQPDLNGSIPGHVARPFFEKSRLPVTELRKIWQLSDLTRDGALNLLEFCIAMHLVVLKRNNIQLPDCLPETLLPSHYSMRQIIHKQQQHKQKLLENEKLNSNSPVSLISNKLENATKEWTTFNDSPPSSTISENTISTSSPTLTDGLSLNPGPVNFDFHKSAVETDPKILHPVPMRVTPNNELQPINSEDHQTNKSFDDTNGHVIQRPQVQKKKNFVGALPPPPVPNNDVNTWETSIGGPMSLPATNHHYSNQTNTNSFIVPPFRKDGGFPAPPPPPPPRPALKVHMRSSSLDLNKYGSNNLIPPSKQVGGLLPSVVTQTSGGIQPPAIPPRLSPTSSRQSSPQELGGNLLPSNFVVTSTPLNKSQNSQKSREVLSSSTNKFSMSIDNSSLEQRDKTVNNEKQPSQVDASWFANFDDFQNNTLIENQSQNNSQLSNSFANQDISTGAIPRKHGAFEVYRKPGIGGQQDGQNISGIANNIPINESVLQTHQTTNIINSQSGTLRLNKKEMYKRLQDQNAVLLRICQELSQELAEVREERIALSLKLEQQKKLTDNKENLESKSIVQSSGNNSNE